MSVVDGGHATGEEEDIVFGSACARAACFAYLIGWCFGGGGFGSIRKQSSGDTTTKSEFGGGSRGQREVASVAFFDVGDEVIALLSRRGRRRYSSGGYARETSDAGRQGSRQVLVVRSGGTLKNDAARRSGIAARSGRRGAVSGIGAGVGVGETRSGAVGACIAVVETLAGGSRSGGGLLVNVISTTSSSRGIACHDPVARATFSGGRRSGDAILVEVLVWLFEQRKASFGLSAGNAITSVLPETLGEWEVFGGEEDDKDVMGSGAR